MLNTFVNWLEANMNSHSQHMQQRNLRDWGT